MARDTETGRHHAKKHIGTDRQCTARNTAGKRCEKHVVTVKAGDDVAYGTVCGTHGGKRQKTRLIKELQGKKLEKVAKRIGTPRGVDPAQALLEQVWEAAGNVAWYRERLRMLQTPHEVDPRNRWPELFGEDVEGTGDEEFSERSPDEVKFDENDSSPIRPNYFGPDHLGNLAPHVLVKLYNEERDKLVRYAKTAIECGIAERNQQLAEMQTQIIVQIILRILEHPNMGLTHEQRSLGRRIGTEALREYGDVAEGRVLRAAN